MDERPSKRYFIDVSDWNVHSIWFQHCVMTVLKYSSNETVKSSMTLIYIGITPIKKSNFNFILGG